IGAVRVVNERIAIDVVGTIPLARSAIAEEKDVSDAMAKGIVTVLVNKSCSQNLRIVFGIWPACHGNYEHVEVRFDLQMFQVFKLRSLQISLGCIFDQCYLLLPGLNQHLITL